MCARLDDIVLSSNKFVRELQFTARVEVGPVGVDSCLHSVWQNKTLEKTLIAECFLKASGGTALNAKKINAEALDNQQLVGKYENENKKFSVPRDRSCVHITNPLAIICFCIKCLPLNVSSRA